MTDFNFLNANGSVNVTFRTDLISAAPDGSENCTVCAIDGLTTDTNHVFANWQRNKYSVAQIKQFASDNALKLTALQVSKPGSSSTVMNTPTLAAPTGLTGTVNSATQITVNWTKTPLATGYVLQRATDAGFTANVVNTTLGDVALKVVTGLTTGTQYYFRIKATAPYANDSANTASINRTTS